jgi:dienelactone hydrolase
MPDGNVTLGLDGRVLNQFNFTGTFSNQLQQTFDLYPVDASSNLFDWARIALILRTNSDSGPLVISDTNAVELRQRFYRTSTNLSLTLFTKPSGPFTVGIIDRVMVDPTRTNLYRYTPHTNAFMVSVWYPAQPPAGMPLALMWDARVAADKSFYSSLNGVFPFDAQWEQVIPFAVGHRFSNAPVTGSTNRFPVIIYSHSSTTFRKNASHQAEELASHGYIVVAPDHTDAWGNQFPDGRYLAGSGSPDITSRAKDIQFLLNELAVLDASDPVLAGHLDLEHIALYGHSVGGGVVPVARSDNRVVCVATYDGIQTQPADPPLQKPLLVVMGQVNFSYAEDFSLFNRAATNAAFVEFHNANHATGTDYAWFGQIPKGRSSALAMDACLVWFFDTYLKRQSSTFPTNSEIYNVHTK